MPIKKGGRDNRLTQDLWVGLADGLSDSVMAAGCSIDTKLQEAVFHVHAVSKVYRMGEVKVQALRCVDFDLYPGEFVVLLGPSGSGKSTLLNILGIAALLVHVVLTRLVSTRRNQIAVSFAGFRCHRSEFRFVW